MNHALKLCLLAAVFALGIACSVVAQEAAAWAGAKVTKTDLLIGETNYGKFAYFFASVTTRAGCHVAKVEGERGKEVFVRRDGQRGKAYEDIAAPVFSPDGSALGYGARGAGGSRFVINDQEGPLFDEIFPDTFVFSNDGKRHAYLARKAGRLVAVVDGAFQAEAGGDMEPWLQPPVFSADASSVAYLEGSDLRKKMRVVVNRKPGKRFDGVDPRSLRLSPDGRRFSSKGDRTIDQMIQAARSGKKNLLEGSKAGTTSKETEMKLTNVARASLEELLDDYRDYLRARDLRQWDKDSKEAQYVRKLGRKTPPRFEHYREFVETRPPEVIANIALCLIHQANYLIDQQLRRLEKDFLAQGGLRERMTRLRLAARSKP